MPILVVDDNVSDRELILFSLKKFRTERPIIALKDGQEALDFLFKKGSFVDRSPGMPSFILLDLKMPKINGLEVLKAIKSSLTMQLVPVVIFSSSDQSLDIRRAYELHANAYVVKPIAYAKFQETMVNICETWLRFNRSPSA